ncbi:uncharacterized protein LOC101788855 isoform X1 [Cavia porcellus]|uniref:uncharacterized protein LOC101788855 isoform X1 n=1 Tax=Cavia porcellus TaxID=10141 RepID=UPI000661D518
MARRACILAASPAAARGRVTGETHARIYPSRSRGHDQVSGVSVRKNVIHVGIEVLRHYILRAETCQVMSPGFVQEPTTLTGSVDPVKEEQGCPGPAQRKQEGAVTLQGCRNLAET